MTRKRILVTGANGLLGHHAVAAWADRYEIHAIVRNEPTSKIPGIMYYAIDLATGWDTAVLPAKMDAVIHLAQSSRMRDFPIAALDIYGVNTHSTALLLDYGNRAGATHFLLASTGGLYAPGVEVFSETSRIAPSRGSLSYYFDAKLAAETLAAGYAGLMHIFILRPFFIYGSGQRETMLIPRLIENVRTGISIGLAAGTGTQLNPVYVADAILALEACLNAAEGTTLNIAGPDILTIKDLATQIGKMLGKDPVFEIREGAADTIVADVTRLKTMVGRDMTSLREGLSKMLAS